MYDDIESDFWKEIFVHMQQKNMARTDGTSLSLSEAPNQFKKFSFAHPEIKAEITNAATYTTWEIFVTPTVKLRLFIQSQIKASLLQVQNNDLVKIADAKFPYNPFAEINEFIANRSKNEKDLYRIKSENQHKKRQLQLFSQFVKAYLMEKWPYNNAVWKLDFGKDNLILIAEQNNIEKKFLLYCENWKEVVDSIFLDDIFA